MVVLGLMLYFEHVLDDFIEKPVQAATSSSSQFNLNVNPVLRGRLRIVGPASTTITHDGTDSDQPFGLQQWDVRNNARNGATVTFSTSTAFRNTTVTTVKRDARLRVGIARMDPGANWAISQLIDQTNYLAGDEYAAVSVTSTTRGDATFNLFVSFVTSDFGTLRAGTYTTTVVGTITAN